MKFSAFSDLHHYPGVFMGGTDEDIKFIQQRAEHAGVAFIIHAGDFCHGPSMTEEDVKRYNEFHIPSYHCLGNHDTDETSYEETLELYHMPNGHYYFDNNGYRFIICDPNYYLLDGEYVHYSLGNYYAHGELRDYMPPEQLQWLEKTIECSPYPCVLISHESFEREANGIKNLMDVRRIINKANKKKPLSVILCINGHYHRDNIRILDNVCYLDLNSTSFDWVNNAHDCYPQNLCQEYRCMANSLVYNDPVHAIITLEGSTITIEGMESSMFMGVSIEDTPNPIYDSAGRPTVSRVQSYDSA